jgi:carbon monoxide dehydrogenase subunit G
VDFENTFDVKAPIDEVYRALLDLERVAPAMPGAQVLEKTGDDSYKVAIKVKMGPVSMTYRGEVKIVERDAEAHSAVLDVKAKEARGQGAANAKVTLSLVEEGDATRGTMVSHVQLSGKAAAMGRGIIEDVSRKLVDTFAANLAGMLGETPPVQDQPPEAGEGEPGTSATGPKADPPPTDGDDEGLPVLPLAAGIAADRMRNPAVLAAVIGGALLTGYLIGRRS